MNGQSKLTDPQLLNVLASRENDGKLFKSKMPPKLKACRQAVNFFSLSQSYPLVSLGPTLCTVISMTFCQQKEIGSD